jgi:nickel-type superoxide dismutase maturation protease
MRGSLETLRAAVLIAIGLLTAGVYLRRRYRRYEVSGWSMYPTLEPGDYLVVDRYAYRGRRCAEPGDIVLATDPRNRYQVLVKRVEWADQFGGAFLVGDNAAASTDSREFGPVGRQAIEGRVVFAYWPPSRVGPIS